MKNKTRVIFVQPVPKPRKKQKDEDLFNIQDDDQTTFKQSFIQNPKPFNQYFYHQNYHINNNTVQRHSHSSNSLVLEQKQPSSLIKIPTSSTHSNLRKNQPRFLQQQNQDVDLSLYSNNSNTPMMHSEQQIRTARSSSRPLSILKQKTNQSDRNSLRNKNVQFHQDVEVMIYQKTQYERELYYSESPIKIKRNQKNYFFYSSREVRFHQYENREQPREYLQL